MMGIEIWNMTVYSANINLGENLKILDIEWSVNLLIYYELIKYWTPDINKGIINV